MKQRLDHSMVTLGLVPTRSQAESFIKLGQVLVNKKVVTKPGAIVNTTDEITLTATEQYVSRAGLKLASIAKTLGLDFKDKVVLDVGSSTGGFTDYALQHGAKYVIAVDVGTNQLHPKLRGNSQIELHEQTDIRDVWLRQTETRDKKQETRRETVYIEQPPDIVLIDVSFISLRDILPHVSCLMSPASMVAAMVKPQFEVGNSSKHKGVIKNDKIRREILHDFEQWSKKYFVIIDKADSEVMGAKGNRERFYLLKQLN